MVPFFSLKYTHTRTKQLDNLWYFFLLERSKSTSIILPSFYTTSKYNCFRIFSSECGINAQTQCEKRQLFQICWNKKHPQTNTSRKLILNFYTVLKPAFRCRICWQIRPFVSVHHAFYFGDGAESKRKNQVCFWWPINCVQLLYYCLECPLRIFFLVFFFFFPYSNEVYSFFYAC